MLSKNQIRDHAFPFNYDTSSVAQIGRRNTPQSFSIKKINTDQWKAYEEELVSKDSKKSTGEKKEDKPIDSKKVDELLDKIKNLKGEKYKASAESQNNRILVIKNETEKVIFKLKEVSVSKSHSWLKTNLWDELVAVSKTSADEIFNHSIYLAVKKPKKEEPEKENKSTESKKPSPDKN